MRYGNIRDDAMNFKEVHNYISEGITVVHVMILPPHLRAKHYVLHVLCTSVASSDM